MRKIYRLIALAIGLSTIYSFTCFADGINVLDVDGTYDKTVSPEEAAELVNQGCYKPLVAEGTGSTDPAGGSGGDYGANGSEQSSGSSNKKTGTATIQQNVSSDVISDSGYTTTTNTSNGGTKTTITTESGSTAGTIYTSTNSSGHTVTYITGNECVRYCDQPEPGPEPTPNSGKISEYSNIAYEDVLKDLDSYAKDKIGDGKIDSYLNDDGKVVIHSSAISEKIDDCDGCPPPEANQPEYVTTHTRVEQDKNGDIWKSSDTDASSANSAMKEFKEDVNNIKNGNYKQSTTAKINGKLVTTYTVDSDNGEKEIHTWSSEYRSHYTIENLFYEWSIMAVDNPEEFGDTVNWHVAEHTEVGAKKHVFNYRVTHWGNYKGKCDWHYIKHYYHYFYWTDGDGQDHREKIDDGDEYCVKNVTNWKFSVPLICTGCEGVKICLGEGCDSDCASNANMVCDEEHNPQSLVKTDNYTELVK